MSVVITTPDNYQTIRKTMSHLRRQTARHALEVVIVAHSRAKLQLDESELSEFGSYAVVEAGPIESIGRSNALGIKRATAPIVALAEDHCFPEPDLGGKPDRRASGCMGGTSIPIADPP